VTFAGSILLIVVGAILRYATHFHVAGLDLHVVGLILIIAGIVGFVVALFQTIVWGSVMRRRRGYYEARDYPPYGPGA